MRVAVIADIHANAVALDATLAAVRRAAPDRVVCLGDVAATGPQPRRAVRLLRDLDPLVVMGNADAWMLDPTPDPAADEDTRRWETIDRWCAAQLDPDDLAWLRRSRPTVELALGPGATLLCYHGSPASYHDRIVADTPAADLARLLGDRRATIFAGGHTHEQFARRHGPALVLNPGSVGLPYERLPGGVRNPPWAEWALVTWEGGGLSLSLRRTPVDRADVLRAARGSGMPHADWWGHGWG